MAFVKGQVANPNGTKANKPFSDALNRALAQNDAVQLRKTAEKLLELAQAGEPWAVQMLADRLDGKAIQQVEAKVDMDVTVELVRFSGEN